MNRARRRFMLAGAAAAVAVGLPRLEASPSQSPAEKFGGFKLGVQSASIAAIGSELDQVLANVAGVDLHWVELQRQNYPITQDDVRIRDVAARLDQRRLTLASYFLHNITEPAAELRTFFEFAKRAGVTLLVGQPSPESFPALDALVKEFDIRIGIHNYGPGRQYDRAEDAIRATAAWDWRIGYCLDTGHCMRSGEDPVEVVRRMGTRLYGLHLREHESITRGQPRETVIGEGALDLPAFCRALRDVRFDGPVSFEMYLAPTDPLPPLRKSIENFAAAARAAA